MRLFAALLPPADVVADLERRLAPVRAAAGGEVRWTAAEQWHVTLAFLADVGEGELDALTAALARAVSGHPRLTLRITGWGAFPRPRRARVVWAGLDGDGDALMALDALAADVLGAAAATGLDVPDGPFSAHLTVARLRAPRDVTALVAAGAGGAGLPWPVAEVALVRSHLGAGPGGRARHEVLARYPLAP